jgi:hypothetical protein
MDKGHSVIKLRSRAQNVPTGQLMKHYLLHLLAVLGVSFFNSAQASDLAIQLQPGNAGALDLVFGPCRYTNVYAVLSSTNLSNPQWQSLSRTIVAFDGSSSTVSVPATSDRQQFYRVQIAPRLAEPNGAFIPAAMSCVAGQPFGLQVLFTNQCTTGGICESSLWHVQNDNACIPSQHSGLDANADAVLQAGFMLAGPLSIRVVSRGLTMFNCALAWYNVTGAKPDDSGLHAVVNCSAYAGSTVLLDIASDPSYLGGAIGFALVTPDAPSAPGTCATGDCCATISRVMSGQGRCYYSEAQYNPDSTPGNPFIHLVAYKSRIVSNRYYLACEDSFGVTSNDFMDLVVAVDGVTVTP